jgi:hypothetical protein
MRNLTTAEEFTERIDALADLLKPSDTVAGRMKARLALDALLMAGSRKRQLGGSDAEGCRAALATANSLIDAD